MQRGEGGWGHDGRRASPDPTGGLGPPAPQGASPAIAQGASPVIAQGVSPVIDADSHKCENPLVLPDFIPAAFRKRLSFFRDRYGEQRFRLLDRNPETGASLLRPYLQADGLGKGTYRPYHEETTLGGLFNHVRLAHMDREGIEAQLIYGSITLGFGSLMDPELAVALCRGYNDYIHEDCEPYRTRLHPVGVLPLQDPVEAVRELTRCVEELGMAAVTLPPHLPAPHPAAPERFPELRIPKHLSHPDFRPLLREAERLDVAIGIHGAPGVYLAAGAADQLDTFTLVHVFANRHMQQVALAKLVFDGVMEELPKLRFGFLEAGCGWLPDLMHALREHWEKRVVGLDPSLEPRVPDFLAALARERSGRGAAELARNAKRMLGMLFTEAEHEVSPAERERFLYEHPHLTRDPLEYLERGQIFVTCEPDDPMADGLPAALGRAGEQTACMAVDYGHWDATLKDCVGLVAHRPGIDPAYARRLLSDNALALYGERLRSRLAHATPRAARTAPVELGAGAPRFDPFRALDDEERKAEIRRVGRLLEERDGPIDRRRRRLPRRDAHILELMRTRGDAPPPRRAKRVADPELRAVWSAAVARVNQAEGYGSRLELERVFSDGGAGAAPIELHVLLGERIHGRILKEICRNCGVDAEGGRLPPWPMRALIHAMQHLPDSLRYVPILCGEAIGCLVFRALRDTADRFADEPAVARRFRALLDEIVADETIHTLYCRARLGPVAIRVARWMAPLVARSFVRDVPELRALGCGPRELLARLRDGIEIPPAVAAAGEPLA